LWCSLGFVFLLLVEMLSVDVLAIVRLQLVDVRCPAIPSCRCALHCQHSTWYDASVSLSLILSVILFALPSLSSTLAHPRSSASTGVMPPCRSVYYIVYMFELFIFISL
jgi:flavin reductase (DIM6/NTAB) family NADH-FMN oxidoreductase RutF